MAAETPRLVGQGPAFGRPFTVDRSPDGTLVVLDPVESRIFEVDPDTGDRTVVGERQFRQPQAALKLRSGDYLVLDQGRLIRLRGRRLVPLKEGRGPSLRHASRLAVLPGGDLVSLDQEARRLLRINPVTGDRRHLGPVFYEPVDLLVRKGRVLVADNVMGLVTEVDPHTGATGRRLDVRRMSPQWIYRPYVLGPGPGDTVLVGHPNLARVVQWTPETGESTLRTTPDGGSGVLMCVLEDATSLADGSLVCVDTRASALVRVDAKGHRTVLSGPVLPEGRLDAVAYAITWHPDGFGLAVDGLHGRLLRFSPGGTYRAIEGAGPSMESPSEVAPGGPGKALVVDFESGLLEVDLETGQRRQIARAEDYLTLYDAQRAPDGRTFFLELRRPALYELGRGRLEGKGPKLREPLRIAWSRSGLLVTDSATGTLLRVDPRTGDRTALARPAPEGLLEAVVELADGTILVSDDRDGLIVNALAGTVVSGMARGRGPRLEAPEDIVEAPDGSLLVCDPGIPGLLRVDRATGDRTLVRLVPGTP